MAAIEVAVLLVVCGGGPWRTKPGYRGHTRGRTVNLGRLALYADGGFTLDAGQGRQYARRRARGGPRDKLVKAALGGQGPARCKLCGARLPAAEELSASVDALIAWVGAAPDHPAPGAQEVALATLWAIVNTQKP